MWGKHYDRNHRESMDEFEMRQRLRIHRRLKQAPDMEKTVEWALTIRGYKPAQVALDRAPIMPNRDSDTKGPR